MRGLIFPLWPMKSQQCILDLVTHDCKRRCQHYSYGAWRHAGRTSAPAPSQVVLPVKTISKPDILTSAVTSEQSQTY